jgi:hypothetical protein
MGENSTNLVTLLAVLHAPNNLKLKTFFCLLSTFFTLISMISCSLAANKKDKEERQTR